MDLKVRPFVDSDADHLVRILTANHQFSHPSVEGPEAMRWVSACQAAVFLVADIDSTPKGFIRAVYDGSRALIHLLSVDPDAQNGGIGTTLVAAVQDERRKMGAPSVSVTVTDASAGFWRKQGFDALPVFLMLKTGL